MFRVKEVVVGNHVEVQLWNATTNELIKTLKQTPLRQPTILTKLDSAQNVRPLAESNSSTGAKPQQRQTGKRSCTKGVNYRKEPTDELMDDTEEVDDQAGRRQDSDHRKRDHRWLSPKPKYALQHGSSHQRSSSTSHHDDDDYDYRQDVLDRRLHKSSHNLNKVSSSESSNKSLNIPAVKYDCEWDRPGYFDERYYESDDGEDDQTDLEARAEAQLTSMKHTPASDDPDIPDEDIVTADDHARMLGLIPFGAKPGVDSSAEALRTISRPLEALHIQNLVPSLVPLTLPAVLDSDEENRDQSKSTASSSSPTHGNNSNRASNRSKSDGVRSRELAKLFETTQLPICCKATRKLSKVDLSFNASNAAVSPLTAARFQNVNKFPIEVVTTAELDIKASTFDPRILKTIKLKVQLEEDEELYGEDQDADQDSGFRDMPLTQTIFLKYDCESGRFPPLPVWPPTSHLPFRWNTNVHSYHRSTNNSKKARPEKPHIYVCSRTERMRRAAYLETKLTYQSRLQATLLKPLKIPLRRLTECPLCDTDFHKQFLGYGLGFSLRHSCGRTYNVARLPQPAPPPARLFPSVSSSALPAPSANGWSIQSLPGLAAKFGSSKFSSLRTSTLQQQQHQVKTDPQHVSSTSSSSMTTTSHATSSSVSSSSRTVQRRLFDTQVARPQQQQRRSSPVVNISSSSSSSNSSSPLPSSSNLVAINISTSMGTSLMASNSSGGSSSSRSSTPRSSPPPWTTSSTSNGNGPQRLSLNQIVGSQARRNGGTSGTGTSQGSGSGHARMSIPTASNAPISAAAKQMNIIKAFQNIKQSNSSGPAVKIPPSAGRTASGGGGGGQPVHSSPLSSSSVTSSPREKVLHENGKTVICIDLDDD